MSHYILKNVIVDGRNSVCGTCEKDNVRYIFKYSKKYSSCSAHEFMVMKRLEDLGLPNFPKVKQFFHLKNADLLIMEYIEGRCLDSFSIQDRKKIYKIVMLLLEYVRRKTGFTHYDLHSGNIIVRNVDPSYVFRFEFDNVIYDVESYGYLPVLIDFGCSYIDALNGLHVSFRLDNIYQGCMFIEDAVVDTLRIACSSHFMAEKKFDKYFPDGEETYKLPCRVHEMIFDDLADSELSDVLDISHRISEILVRIVVYPFTNYEVHKIPNLQPLKKELKRYDRKDRKGRLYEMVYQYIMYGTTGSKSSDSSKNSESSDSSESSESSKSNKSNEECLTCLDKLAKFLSTRCYFGIKRNKKYLDKIYKNFMIRTPLELFRATVGYEPDKISITATTGYITITATSSTGYSSVSLTGYFSNVIDTSNREILTYGS
jgi:ABC1 atypical kinase-like domain